MNKPKRSLDEVLAEIDKICPAENDEAKAERRERVTKHQSRARLIQGDVERS